MDDVRTALRLLRANPALRVDRWRAIQQGWDCLVLDLQDGPRRWIARFPRRDEVRAAFDRCERFLPELGARLPIRIPSYRMVVRDDQQRALYAVYERLPGQSLPESRFGARAAAAWAGQLGGLREALDGISRRTAASWGLPVYDGNSRLRDWAGRAERVPPLLRRYLTSQERTEDRRLREAMLQDPRNFRFRPVVRHNDLFRHHILVTRRPARVEGILDWEDMALTDPAADLAMLPRDERFPARVLEAGEGEADPELLRRAALLRFHAAASWLASAHRVPERVPISVPLREYRAALREALAAG